MIEKPVVSKRVTKLQTSPILPKRFMFKMEDRE